MKSKHWAAIIMGCVIMGVLYVAYPYFNTAAGKVDLPVSVMIWVAYALGIVIAGLFEYKLLVAKEINH